MNDSANSSSDLLLRDYVPRSQLRVPETLIEHPRFIVIDGHNHLGEIFDGGWCNRPVSELLDVLDEADVQVLVDLDGGWGEDILNRHIDHFKSAAPERFLHFGGVNWSQWSELGDRFGEYAAKKIRNECVAKRENLNIRIVEGDMADLSTFEDHSFELIFNPPSTMFAPELAPIWRECYRVVNTGGLLMTGFMNPDEFIFNDVAIDEKGVLEDKLSLPYVEYETLIKEVLNSVYEIRKCSISATRWRPS